MHVPNQLRKKIDRQKFKRSKFTSFNSKFEKLVSKDVKFNELRRFVKLEKQGGRNT